MYIRDLFDSPDTTSLEEAQKKLEGLAVEAAAGRRGIITSVQTASSKDQVKFRIGWDDFGETICLLSWELAAPTISVQQQEEEVLDDD